VGRAVFGITAGILAVIVAPGPAGAASPITEFAASSAPRYIAAGPDGNVWFTEFAAIGRMTPAGAITKFALPHGFICPPPPILTGPPIDTCGQAGIKGITAGPDGNVWFLEDDAALAVNKVGRITPAGDITEFPIPDPLHLFHPTRITTGPDGSLWFSAYNAIGRITLGGTVTAFPIPSLPGQIAGIAAGPDGNLWFTEPYGNRIGRMSTLGAVTEFPIPTAGSRPLSITAGLDSALWFNESQGGKIGRITASGIFTEYPIRAASSVDNGHLGGYYGPRTPDPAAIAVGPGGDLWFTEQGGNRIGRCLIRRANSLADRRRRRREWGREGRFDLA